MSADYESISEQRFLLRQLLQNMGSIEVQLRKICQNKGFLWLVFSCVGQNLQFYPYTGKDGPDKTRILAYFTHFKGKYWYQMS